MIMFSGGASSFVAGLRVEAEQNDVIWLFTDTQIESPDLYRFVREVRDKRRQWWSWRKKDRVHIIADGRDPWQVFRDEKFIGNTRIDPCSKILKRNLARKWVEANCPPDSIICLGITWDEEHRLEAVKQRWAPYEVRAPLCESPFLFKEDILAEVEAAGHKRSAAYDLGFPHDNCGGFCCKAGQGQFALLWKERPEVYLHHEDEEQRTIKEIGKNVAILRDRRGGKTRPMTLREFRQRLEAGKKHDLFEWGGCGCFA